MVYGMIEIAMKRRKKEEAVSFTLTFTTNSNYTRHATNIIIKMTVCHRYVCA